MRPDELHTTFNLDFLKSPLEPERLRRTIDDTLAAFASVGAPPTWTLSNHDETRHVTRYGRAWTGVPLPPPWPFPETDLALGTRRARAMLLLLLALPGSVFLYQGEELGLWEVEDLPDEHIYDPVWESSGHRIRGRDGCRVPIPWSGGTQPFGFGPDGATPWLPQPAGWATLTVDVQRRDPYSTWSMYREALRLRRELRLGLGHLSWPDAPAPDVVMFSRPGLVCTTNCGATPVQLPERYGDQVLASGPVPEPGVLPANTTIWWRTEG
jgi:alpha-glucosidase